MPEKLERPRPLADIWDFEWPFDFWLWRSGFHFDVMNRGVRWFLIWLMSRSCVACEAIFFFFFSLPSSISGTVICFERHFFHELSMWLNARSGHPTFHQAVLQKKIWSHHQVNKLVMDGRGHFFCCLDPLLCANQSVFEGVMWRPSDRLGQNTTPSLSNM